MRYLLDTNICIYLIKQKPEAVLRRFQTIPVGDIAISSITVFELEYGVAKSAKAGQNRQALQQFLLPLILLPWAQTAAIEAGRIRAGLEAKGTPIGAYDVLIGAQALASGLILVSNNIREFKRIDGLIVENWA